MYETSYTEDIKGLDVHIQCTWSNCFTEPVWDRGLCIRSYDRKELARVGKGEIIGSLTGNYSIDEKDVIWVEANLLYCNRRPTGWFRERDIWHAKKDAVKNPEDKPVPDTTNNQNTTKSNNWLYWLSGGLAALKILGGI